MHYKTVQYYKLYNIQGIVNYGIIDNKMLWGKGYTMLRLSIVRTPEMPISYGQLEKEIVECLW